MAFDYTRILIIVLIFSAVGFVWIFVVKPIGVYFLGLGRKTWTAGSAELSRSIREAVAKQEAREAQPERKAEMIACASCGEANPKSAQFCLSCGSPFPGVDTPLPRVRNFTALCGACSETLPLKAKFCIACGEKVNA